MHKTSQWLLSHSSKFQKNNSKISSPIKFRPCKKISITGGKGGVGKTSIAIKTAQELARAGFKVLLIDCDSNLSNTAIKLGLPVQNSFEKLLSGEASFEDSIITQGNFHLLPACNGSIKVFETKLHFDQIIIDLISAHEHEYDYILLDCPAGLGRDALTLNAYSDYRWVIVTPDKSSITDSYSLVKILATRFGVKDNHLLVNMYQTERQFHKVVLTLSETIENFLGARTHILGGVRKLEIPAEGFDTFFLSESKTEWQKNFVKLLHGFTEIEDGPTASLNLTEGLMVQEHDVQ
jgi:flagellar biosynthesis protein FlhG